MKTRPVILVVSDATGETAERMVRSALVQFPGVEVDVVRHAQVRNADQVRTVVLQAAAEGAILFHTLVSSELRGMMVAESRIHGVDAMDLMGPVLARLALFLEIAPKEQPGLFRQLTEAKSRQLEAVEFAFRHDDGKRPEELHQAEVVLVGVSRTMKTPTTLFLGYHGWFAANVPIVPGAALPAVLEEVPSGRVFCTRMSPGRLAELRRVRAEHLGLPLDSYAALPAVREELRVAERIALEHGWRLLEVTGKSVEEVAGEIVGLRGREAAEPSRRE